MDRDYTIVFRADTTQALAGFKAIDAALKNLEATAQQVGSATSNTTQSVNNLAARI